MQNLLWIKLLSKAKSLRFAASLHHGRRKLRASLSVHVQFARTHRITLKVLKAAYARDESRAEPEAESRQVLSRKVSLMISPMTFRSKYAARFLRRVRLSWVTFSGNKPRIICDFSSFGLKISSEQPRITCDFSRVFKVMVFRVRVLDF